jgi:hypothetical protein
MWIRTVLAIVLKMREESAGAFWVSKRFINVVRNPQQQLRGGSTSTPTANS